jgi:hypothetical protein
MPASSPASRDRPIGAANHDSAAGTTAALARLRAQIESNWPKGAGPDPYDALSSPLIRRLCAPDRRLRIAVTQLLRHLPWDIRPWLGIRPHTNPKTVSLLARAYLRIARVDGPAAGEAERRARGYLDWLVANAAPGYSGAAWGYSFPWQSSRLWLERGQPSAVCTAFVAQAFLDAYGVWREPRHLAVARSATRFLLRDCPRYESPTGVCISYTPSALVTIHNANILAAAILAQVWRAGGGRDRELRETAERAAAYTLAEQRADGAWYYDGPPGPVPALVDGFHTGFVLEGLDRIQRSLGVDHAAAVGRGLAFYQQRLIDPDGRPRRSLHRAEPVDIRDCAVALLVLGHLAGAPGAARARAAVLRWTLDQLLDRRGYFYFQHGGPLPMRNRVRYPRWQAWMLLALAPWWVEP